jgi:hypothetical protein
MPASRCTILASDFDRPAAVATDPLAAALLAAAGARRTAPRLDRRAGRKIVKIPGGGRALAAALSLVAAAGGVCVTAGSAQAQPIATGTVTFTSDPGDSIGQGKSYSYSTRKGDVLEVPTVGSSTLELTIQIAGKQVPDWSVTLDAPGEPGQPAAGRPDTLVPGTYTDAHRYPLNGTSPGLTVNAFSSACNEVTGSFTITKAVFFPSGYVQAFNATFVQHCEGAAPALRGDIRISNPPPPTPSHTAVTRPPDTATSPTAGLTSYAYGAAADTSRPPMAVNHAARTEFGWVGSGVLALVIAAFLSVGVVMGVRRRRIKRTPVLPEPHPAQLAGVRGAEAAERRWQRYEPEPPVARGPVPGRVIAVSVVLAVRGGLGLALSLALIAVAQARAGQGEPVPSWYTGVMVLQAGICAGEILSGSLLWRGRYWPLGIGRGVLWLDIAEGTLIMLATSFNSGGLAGIAVDSVILWMLSWPAVKDWCF